MCVEKPAAIEQQDHLPVFAQRRVHRLMQLPRDRPARLAVANSIRRSIVPTAGSGRSNTRRGMSTSRYSPCIARCQLSSDGVAEPSTSGTFSSRARHSATSRA